MPLMILPLAHCSHCLKSAVTAYAVGERFQWTLRGIEVSWYRGIEVRTDSTLHSTATALAQVCLLPGNGLGPSTVTTFAHHAPRIPTKKCWLADQQYFQIKRLSHQITVMLMASQPGITKIRSGRDQQASTQSFSSALRCTFHQTCHAKRLQQQKKHTRANTLRMRIHPCMPACSIIVQRPDKHCHIETGTTHSCIPHALILGEPHTQPYAASMLLSPFFGQLPQLMCMSEWQSRTPAPRCPA